jgi:hypothetical protein
MIISNVAYLDKVVLIEKSSKVGDSEHIGGNPRDFTQIPELRPFRGTCANDSRRTHDTRAEGFLPLTPVGTLKGSICDIWYGTMYMTDQLYLLTPRTRAGREDVAQM